MLQRDYIQRLIREFMAALERMLEKKEVEVRREKIKELYNQYVGPYAFYSIATIEDVMKAMAGIEDEEKRLSTMDMLAELYYHEADTVGQLAATIHRLLRRECSDDRACCRGCAASRYLRHHRYFAQRVSCRRPDSIHQAEHSYLSDRPRCRKHQRLLQDRAYHEGGF